MKRYLLCAVVFALIGCSKSSDNPLTNPGPSVYNPNGVWSYSGTSLVYDPGTCGLPSNPYPTSGGIFSIVQNGNSITATIAGTGILYTGTWANNAASMVAIYNPGLPGVVQTDILDFGLSSDTQASGLVTWGLNDGIHSCTGSLRVTATKQ